MSVSPEDFRFVCAFMRDAAAIVLDAGKEYLVETRLGPVASRAGLSGIAELIREVRRDRHGPLARSVVDAMTTNETSFFRDVAPYQHLRQNVLPALINARGAERRLRIWCAAASSGQEPYSLAMLLSEHFPQLEAWDLQILATDISQTMLARCRSGVYSQLEVNRGLPAALLIKYFRKNGLDWQVDERLRNRIEWREFNLVGRGWGVLPKFDLVLLRNVMIYFDLETKRGILANVRRVLRPDGYLFLGTAETTANLDDAFQPDSMHSSCFRQRAA